MARYGLLDNLMLLKIKQVFLWSANSSYSCIEIPGTGDDVNLTSLDFIVVVDEYKAAHQCKYQLEWSVIRFIQRI